MVCTPGSVSGATHTFNVVANTGYADTPDGNSVFMWSYANADAPDNGHFQSPGPVLCVAPAGSGKTTTLVARIAWLVDAGGRLILVSVIDNLLKGASGQAVQNLNVMLGIDERTGLL